MELFVRYFVELDLPLAAVETALDGLPAPWLIATANRAHARAVGFMVEGDPQLGSELAGSVVDLGIKQSARRGSTTIRTMAWALIGPNSARPLLDADLELGSLGHNRCQLALAGRYYVPGSGVNRRIDRGIAQRAGEATIKQFVDALANIVGEVAFQGHGARPPLNVFRRVTRAQGLTGA